MGMLQKYQEYKKNRKQKRVEKALKLVANPKAIKEDRWAALAFLAEPEEEYFSDAVKGLLSRFEYSLEHGILDTREKELAMKGVLHAGKEALPLLKENLSTSHRIAWTMKCFKELGSEAETLDALKGALVFDDVSLDQSAVDKNFDILCYLVEYQVGDFRAKLTKFLQDPDERVRYAAVEVLIEQKDYPELPELLEPWLSDSSAENTRIRQSVIQAFITGGWKLSDPGRYEGGEVAPGVFINRQGGLSANG